jgi:peptide/nickel transport system permease protein
MASTATGVAVRAKTPLSERFGKETLRFIKKRPLGAFGAASLLAMVLIAIFAPFIAGYSPIEQYSTQYQNAPPLTDGPEGKFWFGTDRYSRDLFSRVVFGSRISLYVGILSVGLATITGTLLGVYSAYAGGKIDLIIQRIVDVKIGFPTLIFTILIVAMLGQSLNNVVFAIAFGSWPRISRIARSQAISVREMDYVTAARALGANGFRELFMHVLPNSLTPVIILATGSLGGAIVAEAGLSFLGLGVPPPHPAWGRQLNEAQKASMEIAPWLSIFPGLALTFAVYGFTMFGDSLRDHFDPRLRGA